MPAASAAVTAFVAPLTLVFVPSWISTTGCGPNATPLSAAAAGCVTIATCVAGAAVTLKLAETAVDAPAVLKMRVCAPLPVIFRFANVATPPTALTGVVPLRAPVPDAIAAAMLFVAPLTASPA